jgi:hypothetical protein
MTPNLTRREAVSQLIAAGAFAAFRFPAGDLRTLTLAPSGTLNEDAAAGVAMGIAEAKRAAELLGRRIAWKTSPAGADATISADAIVVGNCRYTMMPAKPALDARLDAWAAKQKAPTAGTEKLAVEAWHHSLTKFGAAELNERYERFASRFMTSDAWLGWCAVKALTEAWLQAGGALCRSLDALEFDAHKGEPLRFEDRALRQPLYLVDRDTVIGTLA